ncbi:MAG: DUF892 family protein [Armatimonadota bacterium]
MPLAKHLIIHLQEMYSTQHAYRAYLQGWSEQLRDQQLRAGVREQITGIGTELDQLRQALSRMDASPLEEHVSPLVQALRQEDEATKRAMPEMTPADTDVHVAMTDIGVGHLEIGMYQGILVMAKELGNQDIATIVKDLIEHEQQDLRAMQELLPALVRESQQQQRAA